VSARRAGRVTLLIVSAALFLAPVAYLFIGSVTPPDRVLTGVSVLAPHQVTTENYRSLVDRFDSAATGYLGQFYLTSLIVSVVVVIAGLVVNSMAGYALARLRWRGREAVLLAVTALIVLPFQAIAVPLFYLLAQLRDTYTVQFLPFIANAFSVYLFHTFFTELPREQEEAARIDGAGPWTTFVRIAVPMARPAFAVVAVLTFLASWSSFLWPVMMIDQPGVRPLPVEIGVLQGQLPINWGQLYAFGVLMVTPALLVFLVFQRWFVRGAAMSGRPR
jgi:multiple sugar transport system permease protein